MAKEVKYLKQVAAHLERKYGEEQRPLVMVMMYVISGYRSGNIKTACVMGRLATLRRKNLQRR